MEQKKTIQEYLNMYNDQYNDQEHKQDTLWDQVRNCYLHGQADTLTYLHAIDHQKQLSPSPELTESEQLEVLEATLGRAYLQEIHQDYE